MQRIEGGRGRRVESLEVLPGLPLLGRHWSLEGTDTSNIIETDGKK
jgi:hypothetical protein